MTKSVFLIGLAMILVASTFLPAYADSINQFTFQGVLRDVHGAPVNGVFGIVTRLFNNLDAPPVSVLTVSGSTPVGSSDPQCTILNNCLYSQNQTVQIFNGVFTVNLGNKTSLRPVNFTTPLYLEVIVKNYSAPNDPLFGTPNGFPLNEFLTPRLNVTAAPFAIASQGASGVLSVNHQFSWFDLNGKRIVNATELNFTRPLLKFNSDSGGHIASISSAGVINGSSVTVTGSGTFTGLTANGATDIESGAPAAGTNVLKATNTGLLVRTTGAGSGTSTVYVNIKGGASAANQTLTIPTLAATDTIAVLGTAQTFTAAQTFSGGITATGLTANGDTDIENGKFLKVTAGGAGTGFKVRTTAAGTPTTFIYVTFLGGNTAANQTLTIPTLAATDTIATLGVTQVFTGQNTFNTGASGLTLADPTTSTKQIQFANSAATAATTLTLTGQQSTSQTLKFPNISASDTIATLGTAQTFTATKTFTGAILTTQTIAPTTTSCGTGSSVSAGSTDTAGEVTTGNQVTCTITYNTPYPNRSFCSVTDETTVTTAVKVTYSGGTSFTVTVPTAADKITYVCFGN
jgi:hypothetical protein